MSDDSQNPSLYYEGLSQSDMEARLRGNYLTRSGWLESAETKLPVRNGFPLPWFTYSAISFLEKELTQEESLFEYGGGQSTIYWNDRLKRVTTVDHDPAFQRYVRTKSAKSIDFHLIEENAELSTLQYGWAGRFPEIVDPERNERTLRSGQLNHAFQAYALKLLEYPQDEFDVVVVDGMARVLSTWAAIQHFVQGGFIIFDNSDRDFYSQAYELLAKEGYRRLDFWGLGPVNPYEWCTSVFYKPKIFTGIQWFGKQSILETEDQSLEDLKQTGDVDSSRLGILVIGYNRPYHLQSVLESLRLQGRIEDVHVWIDGTQNRGEYLGANDKSIEIARRYRVKELRSIRSHLGIEKLMLDALDVMSRQYDRVLVLEDDCFPVEGAADLFEEELSSIANRSDIYSVYGHHFLTEPVAESDFTRFQGWGWAAHSKQIKRFLPRLVELFLMSESDYTTHIKAAMTDEIRKRLDTTPGRNVLSVLESFFSWDSATAFITAADGVLHRRTSVPAVINTGIMKGIGHFREDSEWARKPPFNMITLDEAWACYDSTTKACDYSEKSYGLNELDILVLK